MNKTAIKNYAIWARVQLIEAVKQRAYQYEITKDSITDANADVISGKPLDLREKPKRMALIKLISEQGFDQIMEEAAYTWFNRFVALRYMEVNGYLPTKVRVFSDSEGNFKPEILKEALTVELPVNRTKIMELIEKQENEELYKQLIIAQCNSLKMALPEMFKPIQNCFVLLFPNNLLKEDSVLGQMVTTIPEEDWKDAVQIIGWLYQYYNSDLKDETFALLKKNVKITKERIPAATQLFTPDWIVRYMVENSLGRLWYEGHPNEEIKKTWKYYLDEAQQEPEVEEQLKKIREEYKKIKPEDIKVIDPCMGSGHILVYAFEVLMQIYTSAGWSERDAAESILKNNLYGLDIDDRAGQLAYFAVMMKARKYNRKILTSNIYPNLYAIQESNNVKIEDYRILGDAKDTAITLIRELTDAKEYGSILNLSVTLEDLDKLEAKLDEIASQKEHDDLISMINTVDITRQMYPLVEQARVMVQKYDVVVTNPPYMGASGMSVKLSEYVKENYPDSKSDLFAVFIEKCGKMNGTYGYQAMITQHSWMFLSSFEALRSKMSKKDTINMAHLGARAFDEIGGEVVQTTAFVLRKMHFPGYKGTYCRLIDPTSESGKEEMFIAGENRYITSQDNFSSIPGTPVAYWVSDVVRTAFDQIPLFERYGDTKKGVLTGNDAKFTRLWHEVGLNKIGFRLVNHSDMVDKNYKWIPATSGGSFRRWYGNFETVINMENDSYDIRFNNENNYRLRDNIYYFRECITWSEVSSKLLSNRYVPQGILFGNSGPVCFFNKDVLYYLSGLLNSVVAIAFLRFLSPTMTFGPEQIKRIPTNVKETEKNIVDNLVKMSIAMSKKDWDSYETSWDFKTHPLI